MTKRFQSTNQTLKLATLLVGAAMPLLQGCGYTQGKILYALGVGSGEKVEAKCILTTKPILILIDDSLGRIDWPPTPNYLFDELSQELLHNQAAKKIIPNETLMHLRQSIPDFEKRGAREIGRYAGAEQVIWIEVKSFSADELISEAIDAASIAVTVKVLNVNEKRRSRIRVWPESPKGHRLAISMTGSEVQMAKTKDRISKKLCKLIAFQIGRLFYDHQLGDFERPVQ